MWVELPEVLRCLGGRVRWWQPQAGDTDRYDWALDAVVVGGNVTPPDTLTYTHPDHLVPPLWLRLYNAQQGEGLSVPFIESIIQWFISFYSPLTIFSPLPSFLIIILLNILDETLAEWVRASSLVCNTLR